MPFTQQTFTELVELLATQFAAKAALPPNTDVGSVAGAFFNAVGLLALNIQNELVYVQSVSRMLSSTGPDIDSWGQQFNLPRNSQSQATGTVTFAVAALATVPIVVPLDGIVQTAGGLQFQVIAPLGASDPNFANYSVPLGGYVIQVGQTSVTVTVQCTTAGVLGNVAAGTIAFAGSNGVSPPVVGFSSINNAVAFTTAETSEDDPDYQTRITTTLSTGLVATPNAIAGAITQVESGLVYAIADDRDSSGTPAVGQFTVVVNKAGTGAVADPALVAAVALAVAQVRAAGISATVIGPTIAAVDVGATIKVTPTSAVPVAQALANIQVLVQEYLNGIGLDPAGGLTTSEISELYVIMRTYPNVTNVTGVAQKLHSTPGGPSANDITTTLYTQQLVAGTITLTPG